LQFRKELTHLKMRAFTDLGAANAIFNRTHWAKPVSALDVAELGLELRWEATGAVYLTSHAEASTLLAASLRRVSAEPTLFSVGVAIGVEF
jgi:hypothetical protein